MSGHGVPHHSENREHKRIGIVIAVIAVVTAVIGALVNNAANEMIVKEVQSSNGFAWYQAKRQRSYLNELELKRIEVELNGTPTEAQRKLLETDAAKLKTKNAEYEKENEEIRSKAEAEEREAQSASHRHHGFEYSEVLLHVAVVLCSLTLLTEAKLFFRLGLIATLLAVVLVFWTLNQKSHGSSHAAASAPAPAVGEPVHH